MPRSWNSAIFAMQMVGKKPTGQPFELVGKYLNIWERSGGDELSLALPAKSLELQPSADRDVEEQLRFKEVPRGSYCSPGTCTSIITLVLSYLP